MPKIYRYTDNRGEQTIKADDLPNFFNNVPQGNLDQRATIFNSNTFTTKERFAILSDSNISPVVRTTLLNRFQEINNKIRFLNQSPTQQVTLFSLLTKNGNIEAATNLLITGTVKRATWKDGLRWNRNFYETNDGQKAFSEATPKIQAALLLQIENKKTRNVLFNSLNDPMKCHKLIAALIEQNAGDVAGELFSKAHRLNPFRSRQFDIFWAHAKSEKSKEEFYSTLFNALNPKQMRSMVNRFGISKENITQLLSSLKETSAANFLVQSSYLGLDLNDKRAEAFYAVNNNDGRASNILIEVYNILAQSKTHDKEMRAQNTLTSLAKFRPSKADEIAAINTKKASLLDDILTGQNGETPEQQNARRTIAQKFFSDVGHRGFFGSWLGSTAVRRQAEVFIQMKNANRNELLNAQDIDRTEVLLEVIAQGGDDLFQGMNSTDLTSLFQEMPYPSALNRFFKWGNPMKSLFNRLKTKEAATLVSALANSATGEYLFSNADTNLQAQTLNAFAIPPQNRGIIKRFVNSLDATQKAELLLDNRLNDGGRDLLIERVSSNQKNTFLKESVVVLRAMGENDRKQLLSLLNTDQRSELLQSLYLLRNPMAKRMSVGAKDMFALLPNDDAKAALLKSLIGNHYGDMAGDLFTSIDVETQASVLNALYELYTDKERALKDITTLVKQINKQWFGKKNAHITLLNNAENPEVRKAIGETMRLDQIIAAFNSDDLENNVAIELFRSFDPDKRIAILNGSNFEISGKGKMLFEHALTQTERTAIITNPSLKRAEAKYREFVNASEPNFAQWQQRSSTALAQSLLPGSDQDDSEAEEERPLLSDSEHPAEPDDNAAGVAPPTATPTSRSPSP